ncbi:MAG: VOC family protein, partial [Acidimicrobiales bacterium]
MRASWGHLNVNVTDLERSIEFYERLGFTVMADEIPHLGLSRHDDTVLDDALCDAYGLPPGTSARGCILELGGGFPKLDLTAYDLGDTSGPQV